MQFTGRVTSRFQQFGRLVQVDLNGACSRENEPFWVLTNSQTLFMDNQIQIDKIRELVGQMNQTIGSYDDLLAVEQRLVEIQQQLIELGREAAQHVGGTTHVGA